MKELDFNLENAVKVVKVIERGLSVEHMRDIVCARIIGKPSDKLLEGMAKGARSFVDILTKETEFRDAIKFLSEQGVTIE